MFSKRKWFLRFLLISSCLFSSTLLKAQDWMDKSIRCKYAFEEYRIYCLALSDSIMVSSVELEKADPVWCKSSTIVPLMYENAYVNRIYDKGEVIKINLGHRCTIKGYKINIFGKTFSFNAE